MSYYQVMIPEKNSDVASRWNGSLVNKKEMREY